MAEEAARRVQTAVDKVVDELDSTYLRKLLGSVHKCAFKCCEDSSLTMQNARRCIANCSEPLSKAQSKLEGELENFQDRIKMCVVQCENDVRDQLSSRATEAEAAKLKTQYDACVVKCADKHVALVPQLLQRMKDVLTQG